MSMNRTIQKIVPAIAQSEGVGARVRRSIGTAGMRRFTPFLMLDHFVGSGDGGFPEHPHLGQETITYMLEGAMAHEDFTGSKGILRAGDLQFMTAGKGVVHSEMPVITEDGVFPDGMQLWVDLPKELKESEPRYRDLREWEIPVATDQDGKMKVKVISGKAYGVESLQDLAYTPVHYYHYFLKPGAKFTQATPDGWNFFLYTIKGDGLSVDGKSVPQHANAFFNRDGVSISGENTGDNDSEFILVGGEVLDQEVVHYGPFVATSAERIQRAFYEYQTSSNGFKNLKSWKTLISSGVTKDMIENELGGNLEKRKLDKEAYLAKKSEPVKDEL